MCNILKFDSHKYTHFILGGTHTEFESPAGTKN